MPDQVRHDGHKLSAFLNYDTVPLGVVADYLNGYEEKRKATNLEPAYKGGQAVNRTT